MNDLKRTIAIDGPAASGKGTIARSLALHFGFAHLDTGLLYRAVSLRTLQGEEPVQAARALRIEDIERDGLRDPDVSLKASEVAANPDVREALVAFQRSFARRDGGAVLDGRDIGTVICPDADAKLFVTARPSVRAARRHSELERSGHESRLRRRAAGDGAARRPRQRARRRPAAPGRGRGGARHVRHDPRRGPRGRNHRRRRPRLGAAGGFWDRVFFCLHFALAADNGADWTAGAAARIEEGRPNSPARLHAVRTET